MAQAAASEKEEQEALPSEPEAPKPANPWLPVIVVAILAPAISIAAMQFVVIPRLKAAPPGASAPAEKGAAEAPVLDKSGKPQEYSYAFENIVVNLSGSKGTRYLKASFTAYSSNPNLKAIVEEHKSELFDLAIGVLSDKTVADVEGAGAKNLVRNDLLENFNQALKGNVIEQVYFTEFVTQ